MTKTEEKKKNGARRKLRNFTALTDFSEVSAELTCLSFLQENFHSIFRKLNYLKGKLFQKLESFKEIELNQHCVCTQQHQKFNLFVLCQQRISPVASGEYRSETVILLTYLLELPISLPCLEINNTCRSNIDHFDGFLLREDSFMLEARVKFQ